MVRSVACLLPLLAGGAMACEPTASTPPVATATASAESTAFEMTGTAPAKTKAVRSSEASDERLTIFFEVLTEVKVDRIPMRTVVLHFVNPSKSSPVRIYLPEPDAFRFPLSSLRFVPKQGQPFVVPEPRPHGYTVSERDFHLIPPGDELTFEQTFTLDPMTRGRGTDTERRPGFEDGAPVEVSWSYRNSITRWEGGKQTLDGVTKPLFGGAPIPHIWTGELTAELDWVVR